MFHAFLPQTEYFVSTIFYPESGPRAASLASVRIQKKYLPYRPSQAIVQDDGFSSGAWDRA